MFGTRAVPRHVAIIMDGNGRWATAQRLARTEGHREGAKSARAVIDFALENGISALTLFAFSTENWQRPEQEVSFLFETLLKALTEEAPNLCERSIALRFIGSRERLPEGLTEAMAVVEAGAPRNPKMILNLAIDYGGQWDIVQAAQKIAAKVSEGCLSLTDINESCFEQHLSLAGSPPVDLIIRTGGVQRISNFLLWEASYAELYFCDTMWPSFRSEAFEKALLDFSSRERRYGKTSEQVGDYA